MGKSKILSVQPNGTYESKFGLMYKAEVTLEDGTAGEVSSKTPDRWKAGDEVEYTLNATDYGNKLKLSLPDFNGSNPTSSGNSVGRYQDRDEKRQHLIMNQWAIRLACEWEWTNSPPDKQDLRHAIALAKQLKEYAMDLDNVDVTLQAEDPIEMPF